MGTTQYSPHQAMAEDFNISRSGRVRKKSSKLSNYQSVEDGEDARPLKRICGSLILARSEESHQPPDQLLASEDEQSYYDIDGDSTNTTGESQIVPEYNKTTIIKKPQN